MSAIVQGYQLTALNLGTRLKGQSSDITTNGAKTYSIFTVTGGEAMITGLWAKATTALTVTNTVNVQVVPTAGSTMVIVTATDLGTTDTTVGTVIGIGVGANTPTAPKFLVGGSALLGAIVTTGSIKSVVTGTGPDGGLDWYCTWLPLTPGATVVASTVAPV